MTKAIKLSLKIFAALIILVIGILVAVPLFFEDDIMKFLKSEVNKTVNATVDFTDIDLSLIRNFPKVSLDINNISMINKAPFEGDTLFFSENISLKLSLSALFNEGEPYDIIHVSVNNAKSRILVNTDGKANYDIALAETTTSQTPSATETETSETTLSTNTTSSDAEESLDSEDLGESSPQNKF